MNIKPPWILFLALLTFSASSTLAQRKQIPPTSVNNFYGVADDGKYTNKFFGFTFDFPSSYTVMESEEAKLYSKVGTDSLKLESPGKSKRIDEAVVNQATLLGVLEKPYGMPGNSVIELVVRKQAKGVTANMALAASASMMTSSAGFKLTKSFTSKFGGQNFSGARFERKIGEVALTQELYVLILKGYSVAFGVTYSTEDGRKNLVRILDTLKFVE